MFKTLKPECDFIRSQAHALGLPGEGPKNKMLSEVLWRGFRNTVSKKDFSRTFNHSKCLPPFLEMHFLIYPKQGGYKLIKKKKKIKKMGF